MQPEDDVVALVKRLRAASRFKALAIGDAWAMLDEASDALERLHQSREAGWQDISTAPMEDTVDLWVANGPLTGGPERIADCWNHDGQWWCGDAVEGNEMHDRIITHWRPLPTPPTEGT